MAKVLPALSAISGIMGKKNQQVPNDAVSGAQQLTDPSMKLGNTPVGSGLDLSTMTPISPANDPINMKGGQALMQMMKDSKTYADPNQFSWND